MGKLDLPTILPVIATLVGIFIGWLLNELSYIIRCHREDRKQLKEVLHNLLETWYLIRVTNTEKIADLVAKEVKHTLLPIYNEPGIYQLLRESFNQYINSILEEFSFFKDIKEVETRYQDSVRDLASVDPILAYTLSGKKFVFNYLEYLDFSSRKIESLAQSDKETKKEVNIEEVLRNLKELFKTELYENALSTLKQDIRQVAWKVGPITWIQTRRLLRKSKLEFTKKEKQEMIDLFRKIMEGITVSIVKETK
jgi:hypothetical protein